VYDFYQSCEALFRTAREANYAWRVYGENECPMKAHLLNGDMCIIMRYEDGVFRISVETMSSGSVVNEWLVTPDGIYKGNEFCGCSEPVLENLLRQAAPCDVTGEVYAYEYEGFPVALTYFDFIDRVKHPEIPSFSIVTPVYIREGWTGPSFGLTPSQALVDGAAYRRDRDDALIRRVSAEFNQSYNPVLWWGDRIEVTGHEKWTGHSGPVTFFQVGYDSPQRRGYVGPAHDVRYAFGMGTNTRSR